MLSPDRLVTFRPILEFISGWRSVRSAVCSVSIAAPYVRPKRRLLIYTSHKLHPITIHTWGAEPDGGGTAVVTSIGSSADYLIMRCLATLIPITPCTEETGAVWVGVGVGVGCGRGQVSQPGHNPVQILSFCPRESFH